MKKKQLKTIHLRKRLIANMQANQLEALKGGTRPGTDEPADNSNIEITFCPGYMFCVNNMSE